jgi:hypothetical protein
MEGFMNLFTVFILVAVAAVIFSLISGVYAMAHEGQPGHRSSAEWMTWRVVFQAGAIALILLAMLGAV